MAAWQVKELLGEFWWLEWWSILRWLWRFYDAFPDQSYWIVSCVVWADVLWPLGENKTRKKWKVPPATWSQNSGGANIPWSWAFCSQYTKNRTKPKPNKCGLYARLLQVFPASRQPQPIPTQNASRRQPFIFRRIQSQKGGYFKAVTVSKNTSSNCTIQRTIFYAIFYCLFFNLFLHFWLYCGIL